MSATPDPVPQRRVLRWVVPVDDADHEIPVAGPVLAVGAYGSATVEFWTLEALHPEWPDKADEAPERTLRVFGTGHEVPENYTWVGSASRHATGLVRHLFERGSSWPVRIELQGDPRELKRHLRELIRTESVVGPPGNQS